MDNYRLKSYKNFPNFNQLKELRATTNQKLMDVLS